MAKGIDRRSTVPTQWQAALSPQETDHCVGYPVGVDAVVSGQSSLVESGQLAADAGRTFTALQFAGVAKLETRTARDYLECFEETGVVEKVCRSWRFTPFGLEIAKTLSWWGGTE